MLKKKGTKRFATIALTMVLLALSMPIGAQAAAKTKLSKSSVTVYVGETAKIEILNNSKTVAWSVTNANIRITKKTARYAKIKGVKSGTSYIKAKVGGKVYKCKVSVKTNKSTKNEAVEKFDKKAAKKSVEIKKFSANGYLYARVKSKYKYPIDISAKCTFYDSDGNPVNYENDSVSFLEKGRTCFLKFSLPSSEYSSYKIEYTYEPGLEWFYHTSVIKDLSLTKNFVDDEYNPYLMLQVSNSGKEECYYCEVAVVYYDSNDKIISVELESIGKIPSGGNETKKSYVPYSRKTMEEIKYDHYEAFITYAYHLGKAGETT